MKVASFLALRSAGVATKGHQEMNQGILPRRQYQNPGLCESLEDNLRVLVPLVRAHPHL